MIHKDIIQGSDEWLLARCGLVTASRVSDVVAMLKSGKPGASRATYMGQLIAERLSGEPASSFSSAAMVWGAETEPMARGAYEWVTGFSVEEAGFICIECEIPEDLKEEMEKLRQDIETHIRMFGDTIDQIRQRLVEARGIANNKKAYEDIARLGSFQANSAKQTREINRVLRDSKTEFEEALNTRKQ